MATTPMMEQYEQIKAQYEDCILFYRLGDFYEMFNEDALIASKELELTLTGRNSGGGERAPMCGVPFHSADSYIARLVGKGYKVAICEQTEDPATTKGLVKRDVIRIITPGTVTDTAVLDDKKNNFLSCIYYSEGEIALVFADITTGELFATKLKESQENALLSELSSFAPTEIIFSPAAQEKLMAKIALRHDVYMGAKENELFDYATAKQTVLNAWQVQTLGAVDLTENDILVCAVGGALRYLFDTQKMQLSKIFSLKVYQIIEYMGIDYNTRRNLELTESMRDKAKRGSLLWVLDKTKTSMGGRLLHQWIDKPLISKDEIESRLSGVEELKGSLVLRDELREIFDGVYDITRIINRISLGSANPRDMLSLKQSLSRLPELKEKLSGCASEIVVRQNRDIDALQDVYTLLEQSIDEEAPAIARDGGIIKKGYHAEIDELRLAETEGKNWLADVQAHEREVTGIKTLKVGYNKVFGYYIEVSKGQVGAVPDYYIRKQTLTNGERYITPKLKEIEDIILGGKDRLLRLELHLFEQIKNCIAGELDRLRQTANAISVLDVLASLAEVADKNGYTKPIIDTDGRIEIKDGRHPVVEKMLKNELFVPNDTILDTDESRLCILTGPNMAGKSTYMRQVALITLMAQIGSFVPAGEAHIGIVDKIFTRVGASDDLSTGQSTFMLEMTEVSAILAGATKNSLVIFDEIGRGTSTYDGLSIAWAVAEYVLSKKKIGAKTLFATHYHEMTTLEEKESGVKNYSIAVKKRGDSITFLRKIIPGGADRSYGIEVAALAGVPNEVTGRAKEILKMLESESDEFKPRSNAAAAPEYGMQMSLGESVLAEELRRLDVTTLTPIEALNKLYELANKAKEM
ncbi:MAG: DNA mismatch repair protein MutS [Clostridia bacterium]|nr:DNA mismatch repair protein MutS [Clostridia bacterium]